MRALSVAILDLGSDLDPGVRHAEEQGLVQQFATHAAAEALDVAVLHWHARRYVMPLNADLAAPCERGTAGELGAIVAGDYAGLAPLGDQPG